MTERTFWMILSGGLTVAVIVILVLFLLHPGEAPGACG